MDPLKIRCAVVDDEPLAVEKMTAFIRKVHFLDLAGAFQNAIGAMHFMKTHPVDLLFLDIQMEDLTGIQLLEILKEKPFVVITTAYSEYALKGYELDVTDYLLKPISFERFLQAVNKVADKVQEKRHFMEPEEHANHNAKSPEMDFMLVKTDYHMEKINYKDVLYIEGMKDYLGIITPEKRIMTLMNFSTMEEMLPSLSFCRIHKSYIIALSKIDKIERNQVIINKERLPIGDSYRKHFFDTLKRLGIIQ